MKTRRLTYVLFIICFLGCSYDSEDDLIENISEDNGDGTPELVTYDDNIASIMQSSCIGCHGNPPTNGAPFGLTNFNQVSQRVGGILNRMSLSNGSPGAMPPSGRLPQATIDLIDQWIEDGLLEN
ncbi:hypothetical protein [Winogradskyella sp. A2]|uniref:hypothetical protein n=1 Tax=Winogradskyella sp. A2 TaxID=3366944 RepID=UPI00398C3A22